MKTTYKEMQETMNDEAWALYQNAALNYTANVGAVVGGEYPPSLQAAFSPAIADNAINEIRQWAGYAPTPLYALNALAKQAKTGNIFYKDESRRFGLGSFKALGGAHAVYQLLAQQIYEATAKRTSSAALAAGEYAAQVSNITVATATDGNHGRSVAWGAKMFGCQCRIYIHTAVSEERQRAMESLGATVTRIDGNYDDSVRIAAADAEESGWFVVSDTSYPGYEDVPRQVMAGYCLMMEETLQQLPESLAITHLFVQGGVGGLAAAAAMWFWHKLGAARPKLIIAEPVLADCLYQSAKKQTMTAVHIGEETMMAGLSCGEPSLLAWQILQSAANDFITIEDALIPPVMRYMAHDMAIECGESAAAGLAAFLAIAANERHRRELAVNADSNILVLGTEGATDPQIYAEITGLSGIQDSNAK
ncbi:MAG: diaminopropionate ammonia-lyase [Gammaproteobacteria bacterium WSBS_2016_MAG_OTU1]